MGVYLDKDIGMATHIRKTCEKANKMFLALVARIIPNLNLDRPQAAKQRVLATRSSQLLHNEVKV